MRDDDYLLMQGYVTERRFLNVLANFLYLEAMRMAKVDLYMA